MPEIESTAVPSFETVEQLEDALKAKGAFEPVDLYPRDGTVMLAETEARIAELIEIEADELLLCNSGMSAIAVALSSCRNADSVIAASEQLYSQTISYLDKVNKEGTKVVSFDASRLDIVDKQVRKHRPSIILAETVGNGPDVPVLDVPGLLELESVQDTNPTILLDNTLPLSTSCPLTEVLESDLDVVVIESGTKSYTFNRELSGLVFTNNPERLKRLQQTRRTIGATPGIAQIERIAELLPESSSVFHNRNRQIFNNTAQLARFCFDALQGSLEFVTSHPWLQGDEEGPASPVFFIQSTCDVDQFELTRRLWTPDAQANAELGQSFGFDQTRILPNENYPVVRISGGAHTDVDDLGKALFEALKN